MNYNLIHSIEDISDESGLVTEPVSRSEMKDYLRLQGFDESGDFSFDDTLIDLMITSARQRIEIYTGCSLIPKRVRTVVTNLCGNLPLPWGPVTSDITANDSEGEEIDADDIKIIGIQFPDLDEPRQEKMVLAYNAGFPVLPNKMKALKLAIMAHVAFLFEHRGDEVGDKIAEQAITLCRPFIKHSPWG
jgi:uncharacterized phiE125 gp8 family phage protein